MLLIIHLYDMCAACWRRTHNREVRIGLPVIFFLMNTTYPFRHFRFADYRETCQGCVNPRAGESFHGEILKIFR